MNDYIEYLVAVKSNTLANICKVLLWAVTVFGVLILLMGILGIYPLFLAIITGLLAYWIGLRVETEYEYIFTSGEMDIDIIFSKEKRKHVTTLDLTKLEMMAPLGSHRHAGYMGRQWKKEDYSSREDNHKKDMYVMYYEGTRQITVELDESIYKAIHSFAPHKVYND